MVSLHDIEAAAECLKGHILDTPFVVSQTLSQITGCQVYLKFENLQYTASFKERGACNKLSQLTAEQRACGVVAMSAGNHAQGVAYHAQRLGIRAVIVMPCFTPGVKVDRTEGFGATVILHGETFEEARTYAQQLAERDGLVMVHPFDDFAIIAGQGTIGLEMMKVQPDLDCLLVAVGGGGLISGVATAVKALNPSIEVIGVQTSRFPAMVNAVKEQSHPQGLTTIAEGIAVANPGVLTQAIIRDRVDDLLLVEEGDIEQAIVMLLEIEKTLVEGAGAVGLAAVLKYPERFKNKKVGLILCGGNIDPLVLAAIIERGMVRAGRLARICVNARDIPGSLARITRIVADKGANIEEVHHHRAFTMQSVQVVDVELVIQTRGRTHIAQVIAALEGAGFEASVQH